MKIHSKYKSLFVILLALLAIYFAPTANASSGGISGRSGKTGTYCSSCHGGGAVPTVKLTGPTSMVSGATGTYTFTMSGGQQFQGGLDIGTTAGTFAATDPMTQIRSTDLTHNQPKNADASGNISWSFNWTAPAVTANTAVTMFGAGLSTDGDGSESGDATGATSLAITVTSAAPAPTVTASPSSLSFAFTMGSTAPAAKSLAISSSGAALNYTTASSATWLTASAGSGTTPGSLNITANPAGLAAGTYNGNVTITSSGASNSPQTVPVTFVVSPAPVLPTLTAAPSSLSFAFTMGSTAPAAKSLAISSSGAALNYTTASSAAWLTASAATGTTPGSVNITANPTGLAAGTYNGNVTITSSGASNSPQTVPVTFVVSPAPVLPTLTAAPSSLSFAFTMGSTAPAAKSLAISSSGAALNYTVASSVAWLTASAATGTTPGSLNITANPAGLAAGTYNGNITITSSGASNSPQTVPVTFVVSPAPVLPTLTAAPSSLSFAFTIGGTAPAAKSLAISSSGAAVSYTIASSATWLTASAGSGTTPGSLNITANPAGLAAGTYNGNITITSSGASNSPQTVPVTFVVSPAPVLPTLTAAPSSLSFAFTIGGTAPAAKSLAISSSGAALNYTTASSATWLTASAASGTTPGSLNITANPAGLAAGTYNGNITITSSGASNSPQTVPVTFVVTAATPAPTLTASPKALAFAYQSGSSTPGSQTISLTSSGSALSYTAAVSGGSWLSATPASGTTPGNASVSVNPASLAAGTYNGTITITAAGASNGPQTVAVTLVVTAPQPPPSGSLTASPAALSFSYARGSEHNTGAQTVKVSNGTTAATFTTEVSAPWISVTPASGTTPGSLTVSAQGSNMAAGTYTGAIKINAAGMDSATVNVTLTVSSGGDDGDDDHNNMQAQPYTYDPNETHSVSASWVRGMGVPVSDNNDQYKKGLLLSKNSSSTNKTSAGATITGVSGMSISEIGFDVRDGGHCTAKAPRFVITTNDNVVHTIAGCSKGTSVQPAPALGWKRMRFNVADPTQAFPPMNPSSTVKSMRVILDEGPSTTDSKAGVVVLDNIDVNGTMIGQGSNPSHD